MATSLIKTLLDSSVAKWLIETYNGSSLGGSNRSVKSAIDSLNSNYYGMSYNALEEIPANTDLNSYTTPGSYVSKTNANTGTLTNCPITGSGFNLHIESYAGGSGQYVLQTIKRLEGQAVPAIYMRGYANNSWGDWRKIV